MRDLAVLPKAHLHLHLNGAIRERTLKELCAENEISAPAIPRQKTYPSFGAFMDTITACHQILARPNQLERILAEILEDAVADGAVWVELSVWPGLFHGRLGDDRDALRFVVETGHALASELAVGFGLMVAANRHEGPEAAMDLATLAVELADEGAVSFGLDGDEAAHPPAPFADSFRVAKSGGLLATPHAGELLDARSVRDALDHLNADRILHGVRAVEDDDLVERLRSSQVCLDVCPTSNFKLGVFAPDDHPFPSLLRAGIACSLNADDPLLFGSSLLGEYEFCRRQWSLSDDDLAHVAACSITSSGAPENLKQAAMNGIKYWLDAE